ncbi:MAG: hypothetical protein HY923_04210 [Elusimicrobia bacterium]|nr:hypothetical protein [Elusimicrobiota bacterium]
MARKAFGLLLTVALSFSWAGPLCAESGVQSHACCVNGAAPMSAPDDSQAPACCRASDALPQGLATAVSAPAPALLSSCALAAEPTVVFRGVAPRFVPAAPQAPPGTHSGLSPPSSGL